MFLILQCTSCGDNFNKLCAYTCLPRMRKITFKFEVKALFHVDQPTLLFSGVISSHCWVGRLRRIYYLNWTLSLEVALRGK